MAMMRAMQQQQHQQQQQAAHTGKPPGMPAASPIPTAFVVNQRENSILAIAPLDKMAIIAQVIKAIDVPTDNDLSEGGGSRTQIYRLTGVDPEAVKKTLEETCNLSPTAHLEADKKNSLHHRRRLAGRPRDDSRAG